MTTARKLETASGRELRETRAMLRTLTKVTLRLLDAQVSTSGALKRDEIEGLYEKLHGIETLLSDN